MSGPELVLVLLAAFGGTLVQGSVGFGFALLAVPALLLAAPSAPAARATSSSSSR